MKTEKLASFGEVEKEARKGLKDIRAYFDSEGDATEARRKAKAGLAAMSKLVRLQETELKKLKNALKTTKKG